MSDVVPPVEKQGEEAVDEKRPSSRRASRLVGIVLIGVSVLAAWFLLVGYFAWQQGQADLVERRDSVLAEQVATQVGLAQDDLDAGSFDLAQRRLDWVLERDGANETALMLMATAIAPRVTQPAVDVAPPTATPLPEPSPTPAPLGSPEAELQRIRRLIVAEEWTAVLTSLTEFQRQYPDYERRETDQLLYDVLIGYGIDLMNSSNPEMGLYYLEQAEALGDLTQEAQDYRTWAELYTQGMSFYGANWDAAAYYFRDLCLAAPFYQDSCDRLIEVLVAFGDQNSFALEWCPAEQLYREASRYGAVGLADKLNTAVEQCALATPTPPAGVITDTIPITDTSAVPSSSFDIGGSFIISATPTTTPPSQQP